MIDSSDTTPAPPTASDRVYFRQLLAGRDFAKNDPIARQMVNFVYAIGDRETGEAVLVDPAYAPNELVDVLEADDMTLTGALVTTLLASRPVSLGTRTVARRSLMRVVASMLGLGYVNTLLSAAFVLGVTTTPGLWPIAAAVGLPVGEDADHLVAVGESGSVRAACSSCRLA